MRNLSAMSERNVHLRYFRFMLMASAIHICFAPSAFADDYTILIAPPPPAKVETPPPNAATHRPGMVVPPPIMPLIPQSTAKPADQQQVEAALGVRDLSRDYLRFSAMFPLGAAARPTFAEFMYGEYGARRRAGISLAGIVAPIIAGLTVMGSMLLYNHGKEDGGGFCNNTYYDDPYDDCEGDNGELSGIIIISTFGSIATIATFVPGIVKAAKYNKRMRRLSPLVPSAMSGPQLSFGLGPKSFSARLVF